MASHEVSSLLATALKHLAKDQKEALKFFKGFKELSFDLLCPIWLLFGTDVHIDHLRTTCLGILFTLSNKVKNYLRKNKKITSFNDFKVSLKGLLKDSQKDFQRIFKEFSKDFQRSPRHVPSDSAPSSRPQNECTVLGRATGVALTPQISASDSWSSFTGTSQKKAKIHLIYKSNLI